MVIVANVRWWEYWKTSDRSEEFYIYIAAIKALSSREFKTLDMLSAPPCPNGVV